MVEVAAIPGLGPFLSFFLKPFVDIVVSKVLTVGQIFLNYTIIDFQTEIEQANYVNAVNQVLAAQNSSDPKVIQDAKDAFSAALKPIIQIGTILSSNN